MKFLTIQNSFFFLFLAVATVALFWLLASFLIPIAWAIILAIIFYPVYEYFLRILKNRKNIASFITLLIVITLFFAPLYVVGSFVARDGIGVYNKFASTDSATFIQEYSNKIANFISLVGINISTETIQSKAIEVAKATSATIATATLNFGRTTTSAIIKFFIMLYLLFFAFRDGAYFIKRLIQILPLGDTKEKKLLNKFVSIVRAIFKGTLAIAVIQGALGGITLLVAGLGNIFLLSAIMTIFAVIPALGPAIILAPIAIFLFVTGSIWQGVIVLVGLFLVSIIDNLLRPTLVGREVQMHDVLIMLSIFGGLATFGFTGFVIGPVIMGLFITMWDIFESEHKKDLKTCG